MRRHSASDILSAAANSLEGELAQEMTKGPNQERYHHTRKQDPICECDFGKSCESQVKARLRNYVDYLKKYGYNEDWIEHDLREDVSRHVWSYNRISIFEHWLLNHCKELILVKSPKRQ